MYIYIYIYIYICDARSEFDIVVDCYIHVYMH